VQTCFLKTVLGEKDDAHVSVVRTFRKHVGDRLVGLLHEIVDNHQRRFSTVKVLNVRQSFAKLYLRIPTKQFLIFSITVDDLCGWRIYHGWYIVDQSKTSLSIGRGSGNDGGKRMNERQHFYIKTVTTPLFILELEDDFVDSIPLQRIDDDDAVR